LTPDFSLPIDAYKAIIDQLVTETSECATSATLVMQEGIYSRSPAEEAENRFVQSLSDEYRPILAKMLREERISAIHDVLALLSWWKSSAEVGFTHQGKPMPTDLSGMGIHGDYVGRRLGWDWPDDVDSSETAPA
jgi:hypothetical protein